MDVRVKYFAGAAAATGRRHEDLRLPLGLTLNDLIEQITDRHPTSSAIVEASSFLIDGIAVADKRTRLDGASEIDILPPFAGG